MEGIDELGLEDKLPKGVTKVCFFGPLSSGAFLLRPMAPIVILFRGAFFTLAPPRGALVLAVDLKLVPPLVPLLGGGMIARGILVIASTSSLMNSLSGITLARVSAPSRLYVEQEAV